MKTRLDLNDLLFIFLGTVFGGLLLLLTIGSLP